MQGNCLPQTCRIIFYGDILECDVTAFYLEGIGAESAHWQLCSGHLDVGMVIVSDDGIILVFTAYFYVCKPGWDNQFFFVRAFFYKDDFVIIHKSSADFDGIIDIAEFGRTISCNEECVRVVILISC